MSLPWFKHPTEAVLTLQIERITERRQASKLEAITEISAMLASGRLQSMSLSGLAQVMRWTRPRLRRLIRDWDWPDGVQETYSLGPKWWTTVSEQSQQPTGVGVQETYRKRTGNVPRGRVPYREREEEEEKETHVFPFKLGKGLNPKSVSANAIEFWTAYTSKAGPFPGKMLTKGHHGRLNGRLKDHGLPDLLRLVGWLVGPHERAVYLRERRDPTTPLRAENCEKYMEMMGDPTPDRGPDLAGLPIEEATQLLSLSIRRTRKGPTQRDGTRRWWFTRTVYDPPATEEERKIDAALLGVVADVGGWRKLAADEGFQSAAERRQLAETIQRNLQQQAEQ